MVKRKIKVTGLGEVNCWLSNNAYSYYNDKSLDFVEFLLKGVGVENLSTFISETEFMKKDAIKRYLTKYPHVMFEALDEQHKRGIEEGKGYITVIAGVCFIYHNPEQAQMLKEKIVVDSLWLAVSKLVIKDAFARPIDSFNDQPLMIVLPYINSEKTLFEVMYSYFNRRKEFEGVYILNILQTLIIENQVRLKKEAGIVGIEKAIQNGFKIEEASELAKRLITEQRLINALRSNAKYLV